MQDPGRKPIHVRKRKGDTDFHSPEFLKLQIGRLMTSVERDIVCSIWELNACGKNSRLTTDKTHMKTGEQWGLSYLSLAVLYSS